jgi:hypothetical protein
VFAYFAQLTQAQIFDFLFHPFIMMWMGQVLHMLKALKELEVSGKRVTIKRYVKSHPYSIAFSFFAGFVAYGFLYSANQLTMAGAFTAGYMADSIISSFTDKTLKRLARDDDPPAPTDTDTTNPKS